MCDVIRRNHLSVHSWKMDSGVLSERMKGTERQEQRKEEIHTKGMQYCANTQYLDRAPQPISREVRPQELPVGHGSGLGLTSFRFWRLA